MLDDLPRSCGLRPASLRWVPSCTAESALMSQPSPTDPAVSARLRQLAQLLREAHHRGPEAQQELANVVEELSGALASGATSAQGQAHLAETTAHLVEALHQ